MMTFLLRTALILIVMSFLLIAALANTKSAPKEDAEIIFYKRGKKTVLSQQSPYFKELRQKCEEFLSSSTDALRDFISEEKVSAIKKNESALEVVYKRPKEIEIPFFGIKRKADHLLIPLTGGYADIEEGLRAGVFFYGPGYGPDYLGPYWAPRGVIEIKAILQKMGINIDAETLDQKD